jgi:hypothetical protein
MLKKYPHTSRQQSQTGDKSSCLRREVADMLAMIQPSDLHMLPSGVREDCISMHERLYLYAHSMGPMPESSGVSYDQKDLDRWMWPLAAFYYSWRGDTERAFADARYMLSQYVTP